MRGTPRLAVGGGIGTMWGPTRTMWITPRTMSRTSWTNGLATRALLVMGTSSKLSPPRIVLCVHWAGFPFHKILITYGSILQIESFGSVCLNSPIVLIKRSFHWSLGTMMHHGAVGDHRSIRAISHGACSMAHRGPIHLGASCRGAVMVLHHPVHPLSSSLHLMLHLLLTGRGRRLLVRFLGFTLEELLTERERLLHLLAVVVVHVVLVLRHTATLHLP